MSEDIASLQVGRNALENPIGIETVEVRATYQVLRFLIILGVGSQLHGLDIVRGVQNMKTGIETLRIKVK